MVKGIKKGDAVFTTNFSFFATAEVISLLGATPIFVDIDEDTFNINPELLDNQIQKVIKESKLIPKCIIPVDLFGQLANYQQIEKIAKKYKLFIIEDAAQSFGASYKNKKSCSFGDIAATSFYPAKPLGCYGDGGAIFTNNYAYAKICKSIRVHGQGKDKYDNIRIGLNSRLDTLQAAILLNKLEIFDDELILRNKIANNYSQQLSNYVKVPKIHKNYISSWAQYSIRVANEKDRKQLVEFLKVHGIPTAIFYKKPFNENKIYNLKSDNFPISKKVSQTILSIPMHPYLKKEDIDKVSNTIIKFYK